MRVVAAIGLVLLVMGILMGLAQGFIDYLPYSIFYTLIVAAGVGAGLYGIHKSTKDNDKE